MFTLLYDKAPFIRSESFLQVITGKVIQGDERRLKSVATKVMTQIACKLGAEPWRVDIPNKVAYYFLVKFIPLQRICFLTDRPIQNSRGWLQVTTLITTPVKEELLERL